MRRMLGLAVAAVTLAGASAVGAVSAQAAASPTITGEECAAAGGQVKENPYRSSTCVLPDGSQQTITVG